jgi:hypothetical protein
LCTTCEKEEVVGEGGKGSEASTKSNGEKESQGSGGGMLQHPSIEKPEE